MASPATSNNELPSFVKRAFLKFKELEFQWLLSLPKADKMLLAQEDEDFDSMTIHHIRHYGEIGFTLAGLKACVLIAHGQIPTFAQRLVDNCLKPVIEQYELEMRGFSLHYISHKLLTSSRTHPGFQGGYVWLNKNHVDFDLVKETFLVPHQTVDELQIGKALGYPLPYGECTIKYMDLTKSEAQDVCCVPMLEYFCESHGGYVEILMHHRQYMLLWKQFGRTLTIDTDNHKNFAAWVERQKHAAGPGTLRR